jgi:MFS family permease
MAPVLHDPSRRGTPTPAASPHVPGPREIRVATTALFALSGAVFGSWAARLPDVADQAGASPTTLGAALLCLSLGALVTMQVTGALCARLGAGLVAAASAAVLGAVTVLPALTTSVTALAAVLVVFGAATGATNVAANSLGVQVEARRSRPLLPSLHAGFSFGGLGGALLGGAVGAHVDAAPHLLGVGLAALAGTAAVAPVLVRTDSALRPVAPAPAPDPGRPRHDHGLPPDPRPGGPAHARPQSQARLPRTPLVLLGVMAGATAVMEGSLTDWAALHLRETLHATPTLAAAGYAAFSLAMGTGRLAGGALAARLGDTRLLAGGAVVATAGMLAAALLPSVPVALAGFALVGLGLANVFPLAMARAGAVGGPSGVGLASTVGYTGLLAGPPLVGLLAEHSGLPLALAAVTPLALLAAGLAVVTDPGLPVGSTAVWRGAASLGPALVRGAAVRAAAAARRQATDLPLLLGEGTAARSPSRPAAGTGPAGEMGILLGW